MKLSEMTKMLQTGRYQAIVKDVAGRRMFLGIERISSRSRKRSRKYMCPPIDLDKVLKEHAEKKSQSETQTETQPESPQP